MRVRILRIDPYGMRRDNARMEQVTQRNQPGRHETQVPRAQRGIRRRGERTRQEILDATLRVIAREGVRKVTHRAVAQEANVNLSLTTYYFVDLSDMICRAFERFVDIGYPEVEQRWEEVFRQLEAMEPSWRETDAGRRQVRDFVVHKMVDYIGSKLAEQPERIAANQHFFFEALMDPRLAALAEDYRLRLIAPFERLCRILGSADPELDAELLFANFVRFEHEALTENGGRLDQEWARRALSRMLDWILVHG